MRASSCACPPVIGLSSVGRYRDYVDLGFADDINDRERKFLRKNAACTVFIRRSHIWEFRGELRRLFNCDSERLAQFRADDTVVLDLVK